MTACSNNHSKRVSAVLAASLVGALSVGAPAIALAAGNVSTLAVEDSWEGISLKWSADADKFGTYSVEAGTPFLLESATDPFGAPVSMSDMTVVYFDSTGNIDLDYYKTPGTYKAVVFYDAFEVDAATDNYLSLTGDHTKYAEQEFKVVAKSIAGAFAYQDDDVTDTSFKFTGNTINVNFADADGNKLVLGDDYTVTGTTNPTAAGTYTVTLKGVNEYTGTTNVTYTVDKIDLSKDEITIAPVAKGSAYFVGGLLQQTVPGVKVMVNGEQLAQNVLAANIISAVRPGLDDVTGTGYTGAGNAATVTLKVTPGGSAAGSVAGSETVVTMVVADELATILYDNRAVAGNDLGTFITSKGQSFDPELVSATAAGEDVPFDVTVTKDGEAVEDWSAPGKYSVEVQVATHPDLKYAGSANWTFTVQSKQLPEQPKVYAQIDGKDVSTPVEYDGEAIVPTIVVKSGSLTLVEGEDYTVTYKKDGKEVDSIVEPGEYEATVDYGSVVDKKGNAVNNDTFTVEVTKATIKSAKADKQVYDLVDGKAVTPVFTAYTKKDCKGLSVTIDPAKVGVTYYEAALNIDGKPYLDADGKYVVEYNAGNPVTVAASDLNEEGWYVATLNVPADDEHITGQLERCVAFQVSEFAAFEDVDASAWYADVVYKAKELSYMNGITGTKLFMPAANITRAQMACTLFNMAGQQGNGNVENWPTRFDDVVSDTWYSQAISWASEAGVMGGYTGTSSFGTNDPTTREQAAAILYNYAKAQGKDVSVKDADAALAKFDDASEVSAWARTAVAWAIENGVLGNGGYIGAKDTITRAEMAAMAVNFQPEALK